MTLDVPFAGGADEARPTAIELFALSESGTPKPLPSELERAGTGRYRARAQTRGEPFVGARIRDGSGGLLAESVAVDDAGTERAGLGPDMRALAESAAWRGALHADGASHAPAGRASNS